MGIAEIIIGFLAGFAGGLGVGGGGILLLWLTAFAGEEQLSAQGINLIFFLPCAVTALLGHWKNGFIKWKTALYTAVFGIPGVLIGFYIANSIDKTLLRLAFALLLLFIGIKELLRKE